MHRGVAFLGLVSAHALSAALVRPGEVSSQEGAVRHIPCGSADEVVEFFRCFWREHGSPPIVGAAFASPRLSAHGGLTVDVDGGAPIEAPALRRALETSRIQILRMSLACGRGALRMTPQDRVTVCEGEVDPKGATLVMGPESTLTAAVALQSPDGAWFAAPSDVSYAPLRPCGDREAALTALIGEGGRCEAASALSRAGLGRIYRGLAQLEGAPSPRDQMDGEQVIELAETGDGTAREAVRIFCAWLGELAGTAALATAASGGVYLTGPFTRRLETVFDIPAFAERFRPSGRSRSCLDAIPVWRAKGSMALSGLSTLFSPSDARLAGAGVLLLDC